MSDKPVVHLWLANPADLVTFDATSPKEAVKRSHLIPNDWDYSSSGWLKLGTATVDVSLNFDQEATHAAAIATMQAKISEIHAKAHRDAQILQEGINKLLAIEHTVDAPTAVVEPLHHWIDIINDHGWTCIKTGCALEVTSDTSSHAYWGDLFVNPDGTRHLFNMADAVPSRASHTIDLSDPVVYVTCNEDGFQTPYLGHPRLVVFDKELCSFSDALTSYLEGGA